MAFNPGQLIRQKTATLERAVGSVATNVVPRLDAAMGTFASAANDQIKVLSNQFANGDAQAALQQGLSSAAPLLRNASQGLGALSAVASGSLLGGAVNSITGIINGPLTQMASGLERFAAGLSAGIEIDEILSSAGISDSPIGSSARREPRPSGQDILVKNQLEKYASYNIIFSLGAISAYSTNNPTNSYRINGADVSVLRTGGGGIDANRIQTIYEALGQEAGNLEYFIDDFRMNSIISPTGRTGPTQATTIEFVVHEPYSMGLFLQSLTAAAQDANGPASNYLQTPYLLEIDFVGWNDDGEAEAIEYSNRKIPIKLSNIQFDVERGGSTYRVTAYPWNEVALLDEYQKIPHEVSITGPSVFEALTGGDQSLTTVLNEAIMTASRSKNMPAADYYIIRFPSQRTSLNGLESLGEVAEGATIDPALSVRSRLGSGVAASVTNVINSFGAQIGEPGTGGGVLGAIRTSTLQDLNDIGASPMLSPERTSGDHPFGLGLYTWDEQRQVYRRGGIELSLTDDTRTFKFAQGTKISKIIEEMVLVSEYGKNAMLAVNSEGMIPWFRIEPQVFIVSNPDFENVTGKSAKVWVFNVVPYEVHSSNFSAPNRPTGTSERAKQVVKSYDYIYSGKNTDVLGFDIKFNAAFFEAISMDFGELNAGERNLNSESLVQGTNAPSYAFTETSNNGTETQGRVERVPIVRQSTGGSYNLDRGQNLARMFHEALMNSDVDLITADLEIWGDPYYIPDSGMGNYNAPRSGVSALMTADGSVDWQRNEIDIYINFRTPIDYNQDGTMLFPEDLTAVKGFSGLYKIISIENEISGNKFIQRLKLIRRRNQELEGAAEQAQRMAIGENPQTQNQNPANNENPAETTGVAPGTAPRQSTVGASGAIPEPYGDNGELATVRTKDGRTAEVAAIVQPNFQALVDELENDYGYEIRSIGGYARRNAVGSSSFSYHASGLAIDLNPSENGMVKPRPPDAPEPTDMPLNGTGSAMEALAAKHGLGWGGAWNSSTDAMHFSAASSERGTFSWPRNGLIPGAPPQAVPAATEPAAPPPQPYDDAILRQQRTSQAATSAAPTAPVYDDAILRQQRATVSGTAPVTQPPTGTPSPAVNPQGTASGLRPYLPMNIEDDRYDFNTGDKIKAIIAAMRNNG